MLPPVRLLAGVTGSNLALQVKKTLMTKQCFKLKVKIYLMKFLEADCQVKIFSFKTKQKNCHPIVQIIALK